MKTLTEFRLTAAGELEEVEIPNPIAIDVGWPAYFQGVRDLIGPTSQQKFITQNILFVWGARNPMAEAVSICGQEEVRGPLLIIGTIWTDQNQPEPVPLTEGQKRRIRESLDS